MSRLDEIGHACLIYENSNEQKAVALPFIREGLRKGEHCIFVTSNQAMYDWCLEFQAFGIDVKGEVEKGALVLATGEEWRQSRDFKSIVQARELWGAVEHKLHEYAGVRILGDAGWVAIEPALSAGQLCHWEATADLLYQGEPIQTICMYDRNQHSPSELQAALRTHATVLTGGREHANPYYEAVRILENEPDLNDCLADAALVEDMLRRLEPVPAC